MDRDQIEGVANALKKAMGHSEVDRIIAPFSGDLDWEKYRDQIWERLELVCRDRLKMFKKFANNSISHQFPFGSRVEREDCKGLWIGTVLGWIEMRGIVYVYYRVDWNNDYVVNSRKINTQYDWSQPKNLRLLGIEKTA